MAITILSTILYQIRISLTEYIETKNCVMKIKIVQISHISKGIIEHYSYIRCSGVTLHVGSPPHRQRPLFWRPSPT